MDTQPDHNTTSEKRRFLIRNCLGRGGFGEVYLATMISAGGVQSEVAVKVLHNNLDAKSQAIKRLRDEGKLLGILNHPAILRVSDLVLLEDRIALVTEYVEGADLEQCFQASPPLSLRATIQVIGQVADALNAAYYTETDGEPLKLVHRDVKPANIRLGKHGDVKLLDFGIARTDSFDREAKTQTNTVIGSFAYMAPERFERHETVDPQGDVFSLGCVLYEHLTDSFFFNDIPLRKQYLYALNSLKYLEYMEGKLDDTRDAAPEVQALLRRLLSYDPTIRPTPSELVQLCEDLADNLDGTPLRRWCRDRSWPDPPETDAPFSGRMITESTLTSVNSISALSPGSNTSRSDVTGITLATELEGTSSTLDITSLQQGQRWLIGSAFIGGALLVAMLVIAVGGVGIYFATQPEEAQVLPVLTTNKPLQAPTPPLAAANKAGEESEKQTGSQSPAPPPPKVEKTETPPTKKAPSTRVTPTPAPPISSDATWTVSWKQNSEHPVELREGSKSFSPGATPPGSYSIWASFSGSWHRVGKITLDSGASVKLECSQLQYKCLETP
jgi:serine/threonine protein kinase